MDRQRPRGREKNITGPAKKVEKRGEGMHTGPVGGLGGHSPNGGTGNSPGTRSTGTRSGGGMMKIIALLAVLLL